MGAEQTLFTETVAAYLSVDAARKSVAILRENIRLLEGRVGTVQSSLDAREATQTDLAQARARLAVAQTRLMDAEAALLASEVAFSAKVGQAPETLEPEVAVPELPASLDEALAIAERQNPEIEEITAELEASEYSVKIAKGKFQPKVDAVANYGESFDSLVEGNNVENQSLVLQMKMPLYQGGREYSAVRRARYSEKAWKYRLDETREETENAVRIAWQHYQSARTSLRSAELAATQTELALEGVRRENVNGQRTVLDVLNAEAENVNARLSVISLRQKMLVSAFELRKLTGTLTAEALGLDVTLYDAEGLSDRDARKWFGYGIDR